MLKNLLSKQDTLSLLIDSAQWVTKQEQSNLWHSPKETHCYAAQPAGPCSIFTLVRWFKSSVTLRTNLVNLHNLKQLSK